MAQKIESNIWAIAKKMKLLCYMVFLTLFYFILIFSFSSLPNFLPNLLIFHFTLKFLFILIVIMKNTFIEFFLI